MPSVHREATAILRSISAIDARVGVTSPFEARGINPFDYLVDVLTRVQDHPASTIDELLPGAWAAAD